MNKHTIDDLEKTLATPPDVERLGRPDLRSIRSRGGRRRRVRQALAAGGGALAAAAVVGMLFGGAQLFDGDKGTAGDDEAAAQPRELSPLAERALAEIPGAFQVSDWQVVIPGPDTGRARFERKLRVADPPPPDPIELPGHLYGDTAAYDEQVWPKWLSDGMAALHAVDDSDESAPGPSTDVGILVDQGVGALGCTRWVSADEPEWLDPPGPECSPSTLTRTGQDWYRHGSFGTDRFLKPGAPMEVFLTDDYSTGRPSTLAIAGIDGTKVARVEFVPVDGRPVAGEIQRGTLVKGDSIFFANVPGELERVVAYDDSGAVIEDHKLRACKGDADCEVR